MTARAGEMMAAATTARDAAAAFARALFADEASTEAFARAVRGDSGEMKGKAVFFEAPLAACGTLERVLEMGAKANAPAEKRVGAIATR